MIRPDRIMERMHACDVSQAELARLVGMSQQAVGKLVSGASRTSSKLHKIARHLRTTPEYLEGETDDPATDAPPPAPAQPSTALFQVVMPSEDLLAEMFGGLLAVVDLDASPDELARELAQLLPTALTQVQGRPTGLARRAPRHRAEEAEALAIADPEPRR